MTKYLIEVPHDADTMACIEAVQIFLQTGSHFLTNADWGCMDGDHKAWIVVDLESKEEARMIVPPAYRANTKIVALNRFNTNDLDEMLSHHQG